MIDFYLANAYWFAAVQLILAMVGMGATLTVDDFRDVFREPRAFAIGTGTQLVLVPLVTLLFIIVAGVPAGVLVGLALIASIPGGTTSNIFTHLAKGNSSLSIAITAITTIACLVTTPLILNILIADYMPASFVMPAGRIALEIAVFLLLPLGAGMAVLAYRPALASLVSKWGIRASLFVILLIVLGSMGAGRLDMDAFGGDNALLVLLFMLLLAILGAGVPFLFRRSGADISAIQIEVAIRNINLGLLINESLFPSADAAPGGIGDIVLFTLLLYGGVQLLLGAGLIWFWRRRV
jgi:BASS family bile acid:Na+ symporter